MELSEQTQSIISMGAEIYRNIDAITDDFLKGLTDDERLADPFVKASDNFKKELKKVMDAYLSTDLDNHLGL